MPYSKGNKKRIKYRKRARGRSKLADKRINTLVEVRMEEVAKKEAAKVRINLIKRNYLFAHFNLTTYQWTPLGNNIDRIPFSGAVVELSAIPHADVEFIANAPPVDNVFTANDESQDGDGVGQGMPEKSLHGRRTSELVLLTGCSLNVKVTTPIAPAAPSLDSVTVRYNIVAWKHRDMDTATTTATAEMCLPWHPHAFGYSPSLDVRTRQLQTDEKIRVLAKGSLTLSSSTIRNNIKFGKCSARFKTPIYLDYRPDDQNGQFPKSWKILACFRSDVPDTMLAQAPRLAVCSKLYYYEP